MDSISEAMEKVIERCDICLNDCIISKELLLTTYYDFISLTIEKEKHNVGLVLHTGSVCFDAIMLTYAAISNIFYNETEADDVISSLSPGDLVIYYKEGKEKFKPKKYVFLGYENNHNENLSLNKGARVCLQKNENEKLYLGSSNWNKIVPYSGDSVSTDGKGLRKETKERCRFCEAVLDMNASETPRLIDTSTVFVMSHRESDELINNLSYRFDGSEVKFTELVTASYFTARDREYRYGGNPARTEPVIKTTGKVSVARSLLLQRGGNKNIGLIICGDELYRRGELEVPELLERQALQYVYLCVHIDSEAAVKLLEVYDNAELFACTKDFLLSHSLPSIETNSETEQLEAQVNIIMDKEVFGVDVPGFIDWEEYKTFKNQVLSIKKCDYDFDQKADFVIQAYSLMNLFLTSTFPIERLDKFIDEGIIEVIDSPLQRIQWLSESISAFPVYLKEAGVRVVRILEKVCLDLWEKSFKETVLIQMIGENSGLKIAVVVPKAYYTVLIDEIVKKNFPEQSDDVVVVNANTFRNAELYDLIIVVGNISGKRFDALRCHSARTINVLLYDAEKYQYMKKVRNAKRAEHILNCRSTIIANDEYDEESIGESEIEVDEVDRIDCEIEAFVSSVIPSAAINDIKSNAAFSGNNTDIAAFAQFTTDEIAFFTKNYKAYVLDEADNSVEEKTVENLVEGDTIIFTRSNSKTRDIVESLLQDMVQTGAVSDEVKSAYYKSREWKTSLENYMEQTGRDEKSMAEEMIKNGVGVHAQTIRNWFDKETHTVRPEKVESIEQIALLTGDDELFDHAKECFDAGDVIYKIHRQILNAIGQAMLGEVTGKQENSNPFMAAVSERIKDAAVVLQIESVTFLQDSLPQYKTNRPLIKRGKLYGDF